MGFGYIAQILHTALSIINSVLMFNWCCPLVHRMFLYQPEDDTWVVLHNNSSPGELWPLPRQNAAMLVMNRSDETTTIVMYGGKSINGYPSVTYDGTWLLSVQGVGGNHSGNPENTTVIIAASAGGVAACVFVAVVWMCCCRTRKQQSKANITTVTPVNPADETTHLVQ